jgi:hypothetical protein
MSFPKSFEAPARTSSPRSARGRNDSRGLCGNRRLRQTASGRAWKQNGFGRCACLSYVDPDRGPSSTCGSLASARETNSRSSQVASWSADALGAGDEGRVMRALGSAVAGSSSSQLARTRDEHLHRLRPVVVVAMVLEQVVVVDHQDSAHGAVPALQVASESIRFRDHILYLSDVVELPRPRSPCHDQQPAGGQNACRYWSSRRGRRRVASGHGSGTGPIQEGRRARAGSAGRSGAIRCPEAAVGVSGLLSASHGAW